MNIFYLDEDPNLCATYHGDKHVVKMILETAQMMSTAHRVLDGTMVREEVNGRMLKRWNHPDQKLQELLYKATHVNHPSCQWIRASKQNYEWATKFLVALCVQYFDRYGKVHKADREGLIYELCELPNNIEDNGFTHPPQVMPDQYKHRITTTAYQQLYRGEKSHLMTWKNRNTPPPCFVCT